jgi:sulfoxide reductase heme-binding subunit YedZ
MIVFIRCAVFMLCLIPFALIAYAIAVGNAGPDPAEFIMHSTGEWAARFLLLSLFASPLRHWTAWSVVLRLRRMFGLYAFFYGCVHLATFGHFYIGWTIPLLIEEFTERPYITVGFSAWLLMLPLALTSTRAMQRRLRKNWQRLHRLVYPAAILVCLHVLWQARSDVGEPLIYIALFGWMLTWRFIRYRRAL